MHKLILNYEKIILFLFLKFFMDKFMFGLNLFPGVTCLLC